MEKKEAGRAYLGLYIDSAPLERQAMELRGRLQDVFDGVGAAAAGRFRSRTEPIRRAMEDWERQTDRLRSSVSELSRVMGQSFAIALTPAAEALNGFMTSVVRAARTFRSFIFSLFGRKAPDALEETADALTDVGAGARSTGRSVAGAAREVRRALMAFDQIHRLDMDTGGSGGSGGSSGGGSGGADLSGLWDGAEELIQTNPFGELLRRLIDEGEYFDAGAALAAKVGQIVDAADARLSDEEFQGKLRNALGAVTEGINGFFAGITFAEEGRQSVAERLGDFVGDAVGLGLESARTLLAGIDWDSVGVSVAQFVNGGIESLRSRDTNLGTVLADWLNMQLGALDGIFRTLEWDEIGGCIADNVNAALQGTDWSAAGRTLADGIRGLGELAAAALGGIDWEKNITAAVSGVANAIDPIDPEKTYTVDGRQYVNGQRVDGPEAVSAAEAFGNLREAIRRALTGGTAVDEEGFSHLSGKFALDVTADVKDARDSVPSGKKTLGGFKATLTEKVDAIKAKTLGSFKATITEKVDAIKAKTLGSFKATLTEKVDSIKAKTLGSFTATITEKVDSIKEKTLGSFKAKLTEKTDAIKAKTLDSFTAKLDESDNSGLTGKNKPWAYAKAWFNEKDQKSDGELKGIGSVWAYAKAWFNEKDEKADGELKGIGSVWAYGKAWFNSYNTGTLWDEYHPWASSYGSVYFNDYTISEGIKKGLQNVGATLKVAAGGGVFAGGRWRDIPQYAGGGSPHGSLFVAGEAGPEIVGHVGGRTEVLNQSQLASVMRYAVASGLSAGFAARFTPHLAVIGGSVSRSEQHLASMDAQMKSGGAGNGPELMGLLRQIVTLIRDIDVNAYLDGDDVTDHVVRRLNARTRAAGVCEVMI